jgi:GT2 family glycosyltransferase
VEEPTATAPPVVAVVVTRDAGPWFDDVLGALARQDYPNLRTLVLDAGTGPADALAARVGARLDGAFVRRVDGDPGFAAVANEAMKLVEGAGFFCFLRDDVALDPPAIRLLVEETYRSNAGLTGPKLVGWDDPGVLVEVGLGADKVGELASFIEPGERDQEQHDAVRDVFCLPPACLLVRTDLFRALGGFDPGIPDDGVELDLAWRVHLAGARVLVVPAARARVREHPPADGHDTERAREQHRLRSALTNYSGGHLVRVLPQYAVATGLQAGASLVTGKVRRAGSLVHAWTWNLGQLGDVRAKRRAVKAVRQVPDHEVRRLQVRGSARLRAFLRGHTARREERESVLAALSRSALDFVRTGANRASVGIWVVVLAVFLFGSRDLVTTSIPAVGELLPFPDSAVGTLRAYLSAWWGEGLGAPTPVPTGMALSGLGGLVVLGAMSLLRTILVLGPIVAGYVGAWRLSRPLGPQRARITALLVYAGNPLPYNALANGQWQGVLAYGALPWVLVRLARMTRLAPFGPVDGDIGPGVPRRTFAGEIAALGILTALVTAFVPTFPVIVVATAVLVALGSLLMGGVRHSLRAVGGALAAAVVAVVLQVPWSLGLLGGDLSWASLTGVPLAGPADLGFPTIARFATGPVVATVLTLGFVVAAVFAVLLGQAWRLAWTGRGLVVLAGWVLVAWLGDRGVLPFELPPVDVLLAPAAAGLALAAACGAASFGHDVEGTRFSWRQPLSFLAAVLVGVATLPVVVASFSGRWDLPERSFVLPDGDDFRVLWVGDPRALPVPGWTLTDGLAYGLTQGGSATLGDLWPGEATASEQLLADALADAANGQTNRLGRMVGPMGVRYIALPLAAGPESTDPTSYPPPATLLTALASQLDLRQVDLDPQLVVYENSAWIPTRAQLSPGAATASLEAGAEALVRADLSGSEPVLALTGRPYEAEGDVAAGTVYAAAPADAGWRLTVGGAELARRPAFGWANAWEPAADGPAVLTYASGSGRSLAVALQAALWVLAIGVVVHQAQRARGPRPARAAATAGVGGPIIDLEVPAPLAEDLPWSVPAVDVLPPPDPLLTTSEPSDDASPPPAPSNDAPPAGGAP